MSELSPHDKNQNMSNVEKWDIILKIHFSSLNLAI